MTRLRTDGAVFGKESTSAVLDYENHRPGINSNDLPNSVGAGLEVVSDAARVGPGERFVYHTTGSTQYRDAASVAGTLGRAYFLRGYFEFGGAVAAGGAWLLRLFGAGSSLLGDLRIEANGKPRLYCGGTGAATAVGTAGPVLVADHRYRMEMRIKIAAAPTAANGEIWGQIYDETGALIWDDVVTGVNVGTVVPQNFRYGLVSGSFTGGLYFGGIALNDDQGTANNSWCGPGVIVAMLPVADVARNNWQGGAGGLADLYDALNNMPPIGVDVASATNLTQIKNSVETNNQPGCQIEVEVGAYTASLAAGGAGMSADDVVKVVRAVARVGSNQAASSNMMIGCLSNPAIAEPVSPSALAAIGSDAADPPVGWRTISTVFANEPAVVLGTRPVVRLRRHNQTVGRIDHADSVALIVEYQPVAGGEAYQGTAAVTGAGQVATAVRKGARAAGVVTGSGLLVVAHAKRAASAAATSGAGSVATTARRHSTGAAAATGAGSVAVAARKAGSAIAAVSGAGAATGTGHRGTGGVASVSGGGQVNVVALVGVEASASVMGGGSLNTAGRKVTRATAQVSGSGSCTTAAHKRGHSFSIVTGAGIVTAAVRKRGASIVILSGQGEAHTTGGRQTRGAASGSGGGAVAGVGQKQAYTFTVVTGGGTVVVGSAIYFPDDPATYAPAGVGTYERELLSTYEGNPLGTYEVNNG